MVRRQQRASVLSFVIAASALWVGQSAPIQSTEGKPHRAPPRQHSPTPTHPVPPPPHERNDLQTLSSDAARLLSSAPHLIVCSAGLQVRVPAGYAQLADSKNVREQLRKTRGPAPVGDHHTTVLYTMDGGVYYKR